MKIIGVITARLASTRLSEKALIPIKGKTFLEHLIDRISLSKTLNKIIIATSDNPLDKKIIDLAKNKGWNIFVGEEDNVLKRLIDVVEKNDVFMLVRITADNIFTDSDNIDFMVKSHLKNNADYTITSLLPLGITAEVISLSALKYLQKIAGNDPDVREHITPYIRNHPDLFKINIIQAPNKLRFPQYRLTCDYPEDLKVITSIFNALYSTTVKEKKIFELQKIINYLNSHPEITNINSHIIHPRTDFQI